MIGTDLCTTKGSNWYNFSHKGSRSLLVWESEDLVSWTKERLVEVGIEGAGCVWAPEAVFCKEENKWFVFFASNERDILSISRGFTAPLPRTLSPLPRPLNILMPRRILSTQTLFGTMAGTTVFQRMKHTKKSLRKDAAGLSPTVKISMKKLKASF